MNETPKIIDFSIPSDKVMQWPNTPGTTAFGRALKAHQQLYNAQPCQHSHLALEDFALAEQYDLLLEATRFRTWALEAFHRESAITPPERYVPLMLKLAIGACTEDTIGVAIAEKTDQGPGLYTFTQLLKHPHWMGLDPSLPKIKGLKAVIFQVTPGTPGFIIALPPRDINAKRQRPFPPGLPTILRDLLDWHGAQPVWSNVIWKG